MNHRLITRIAVFAAIAIGAVSCIQTEEIETLPELVNFSAATTYRNLPQTRTVYSGQEIDVNGSAVERIDWVASTDKVSIRNVTSDKAAVYSVTSPQANGVNSDAGLSFVSGDALTWAEGENTFLSVYPSTSFSATDKTFSGSLPAVQVQDETHTTTAGLTGDNTSENVTTPIMGNYAYMVAKKVTGKAANVRMDFTLAVTAFEFNLGFADDGGAAPTISKFEMISASTPLVGDWSWDGDTFTCPTELVESGENANNKITVNFDGTTPISAAAPLRFTVFALPHNVKDITLKFYLSSGTKTLALKTAGEFDTFTASKKYRIITPKVSTGEWIYTLEEVTAGLGMHKQGATAGNKIKGIRTYRTHVGNSGGYVDGQQEIVNVKLRFSPADAEGNNQGDWSDDLPEWLSSLSTEYQTSVGGDPEDTTKLTGQFSVMPKLDSVTINQIDTHRVLLKKKESLGSGSPHDLALYEISNLATPRSGNIVKTANTYVVDRAGTYMFPLVYGNAIDGERGDANGWNTLAYTDGVSGWDPWPTSGSPVWGSHAFVLHTFRNYLNNDITSPYILDDIGGDLNDYEAVIVWEDCIDQTFFHFKTSYPDFFISSATIVSNPSTTASYKDASGASKIVPYIKFVVDATNIREGNAVIALREKSGEKRIIWSWQIWVSDDALGTTRLLSRSSAVPSNDILHVPVGYVDDIVETKYYYEPRIYYVEVSHDDDESTATPLVFQVTQTEDPYYVRSLPTMTYYQYGRKDPFAGWTETMHRYEGDEGWRIGNGFSMNFRCPKAFKSPSNNYDVFVSSPMYGSNPAVTHSDVGNVSYGIQNPYKAVLTADGTIKGWTYSKSRNLWNMSETDATAIDYQDFVFHPEKDVPVVKTVYDPCPPGFSVPNYAAFTMFSPTGSGGEGFSFVTDVEPEFLLGEVLPTGVGSETICLPVTGFRQHGQTLLHGPNAGTHQGLIVSQYRQSFMYVTCKSNGQPDVVLCSDGQYGPYGPLSDGNRDDGYAVLPAKELP